MAKRRKAASVLNGGPAVLKQTAGARVVSMRESDQVAKQWQSRGKAFAGSHAFKNLGF